MPAARPPGLPAPRPEGRRSAACCRRARTAARDKKLCRAVAPRQGSGSRSRPGTASRCRPGPPSTARPGRFTVSARAGPAPPRRRRGGAERRLSARGWGAQGGGSESRRHGLAGRDTRRAARLRPARKTFYALQLPGPAYSRWCSAARLRPAPPGPCAAAHGPTVACRACCPARCAGPGAYRPAAAPLPGPAAMLSFPLPAPSPAGAGTSPRTCTHTPFQPGPAGPECAG